MRERTANLKPWKPGQSGNPGGRPKRDAITAALRDQLQSKMPGRDERTVAEAIAFVLVKRALRGDVRAIREIMDRTEGKPLLAVKMEGVVTLDATQRQKRIMELLARANRETE